MEIERKWLVSGIPNIPYESHYHDEQFYTSVSKEKEQRMRRSAIVSGCKHDIPEYVETVKVGEGLCREEYEGEISEAMYLTARNQLTQDPITKDWYCYNANNYFVEFSIVDGGVFTYAEVEFSSIEEANNYKFPWPSLVIQEVTGDSRYSMKNYWKNGYIPLDI